MAQDLSAPLGGRKARREAAKARRRRHLPIARLTFLLIVLVLVGLWAQLTFVQDPEGGRPTADLALNGGPQGNAVAGAVSREDTPATITAEGEAFPANAGGPSIQTIGDGAFDGLAPELLALEPDDRGIIPALSEPTSYGPIPRRGSDGLTPFAAYARPSVSAEAAAGRPRIAIIVSGLGINHAGTLEAISALPDAVTLAFAPYGRTLEETVPAARAEGHELLLELPLEPFDYPQNDPGPETLLTGEPARANIDRLFALMAKFGGYAGVINYMGARFTASGGDFSPVMEEIATRGLGFVDDGSSNRSLAQQLAGSNAVPFARVQEMLDANPAREPILAALGALERRAREDGHAVGMATALPVSVRTIAEWARGLAERDVLLVPVSAVMQ
ncbi:divergent polysaccharide deacetylase family protein [Arsenicitalea aurantiaca]|uniref:divergent polysaccharide deacetylase family protein n=1 Tax=Arsenicitalea aurantiaca TaxID=1783274 RepID=UPI001315A02E|nr:divergent polysaccharide deacetylase family protein [Arsenicitalea aurantiaca]